MVVRTRMDAFFKEWALFICEKLSLFLRSIVEDYYDNSV